MGGGLSVDVLQVRKAISGVELILMSGGSIRVSLAPGDENVSEKSIKFINSGCLFAVTLFCLILIFR